MSGLLDITCCIKKPSLNVCHLTKPCLLVRWHLFANAVCMTYDALDVACNCYRFRCSSSAFPCQLCIVKLALYAVCCSSIPCLGQYWYTKATKPCNGLGGQHVEFWYLRITTPRMLRLCIHSVLQSKISVSNECLGVS